MKQTYHIWAMESRNNGARLLIRWKGCYLPSWRRPEVIDHQPVVIVAVSEAATDAQHGAGAGNFATG